MARGTHGVCSDFFFWIIISNIVFSHCYCSKQQPKKKFLIRIHYAGYGFLISNLYAKKQKQINNKVMMKMMPKQTKLVNEIRQPNDDEWEKQWKSTIIINIHSGGISLWNVLHFQNDWSIDFMWTISTKSSLISLIIIGN